MQLGLGVVLGAEELARLPSMGPEDLLTERRLVACPSRVVRVVVYFAAAE